MKEGLVIIGDSSNMREVQNETVHLVVTSPPYPMISIWDDIFAKASARTYDQMHEYLAQVWQGVGRVLVPGGIVCVNIGDATRSVDGIFRVYMNHSRVIETFERLGFVTLPYILWKKPTTKPQYKGKGAFLGSGFLPPNAYVTLDMEYILIFRKGGPRSFMPKDPVRYNSRFTKAERDKWFSQVWAVAGARQNTMDNLARRSGSFPEEIPYRLVRMFSVIGDTVLDPFLGTGTTAKVALGIGRKFVGYECLEELADTIKRRLGPLAAKTDFQKQATSQD